MFDMHQRWDLPPALDVKAASMDCLESLAEGTNLHEVSSLGERPSSFPQPAPFTHGAALAT